MNLEEFILKKSKELGHDFSVLVTKVVNDGKVSLVVRVKEDEPTKPGKIVNFPFRSGENIKGEVNRDAFQKRVSRKPKKLGDAVSSLISMVKRKYEDIKAPEENLDYYIDEVGREYHLFNGIKKYIDSRGFYYFIKIDKETGEEIEYVMLENDLIGDFVNRERTLVRINGHIYEMDNEANIDTSKEIFLDRR